MWQHGLTSVSEMQTVLHTMHMSIAERLASKFVTLKTKNLVTCMLKDGYEEECANDFFSLFMLGVVEYVDDIMNCLHFAT